MITTLDFALLIGYLGDNIASDNESYTKDLMIDYIVEVSRKGYLDEKLVLEMGKDLYSKYSRDFEIEGTPNKVEEGEEVFLKVKSIGTNLFGLRIVRYYFEEGVHSGILWVPPINKMVGGRVYAKNI